MQEAVLLSATKEEKANQDKMLTSDKLWISDCLPSGTVTLGNRFDHDLEKTEMQEKIWETSDAAERDVLFSSETIKA